MTVNKISTQSTNISSSSECYSTEIKTYPKDVTVNTHGSFNAAAYGFFVSDVSKGSGFYSITSSQASYRNLNSKKT